VHGPHVVLWYWGGGPGWSVVVYDMKDAEAGVPANRKAGRPKKTWRNVVK